MNIQVLKLSVVILLVIIPLRGVYAQMNIHSIGADLGVIQSLHPYSDFIDKNPILFPEIYLGGDFMSADFRWKANAGYWNDELASLANKRGLQNYSLWSLVINTEMAYLFPDSNPAHDSPLRILAGLSYHFISAEDIQNYESGDKYRNNFTDNLFYFNTGLELHVFIKRHLSVFAKGLLYIQINKNEEYIYTSPRLQLSLGLNYSFSH